MGTYLYYYQELPKQQQRIYQIMKEKITALEDSFELPRIDDTALSDIFYKLRLDCPDIFYAYQYRYSFYQDSNKIQMKPEYLFDKKKIKEHQQNMRARVEKLARQVRDKNVWEKEKYIHDFICEHVTYDKLKKQYSHEIIGPLGQGVGVCEGIAKSVKILCDELSIPCIVVISENNPEKKIKYRHAWNLIQIQGQWYHLDATFDHSVGKKEIRYDYFNLDDKSMYRDHEPSIYPVPACTDGTHVYYLEKKLSFTKLEEVEKRSLQALKKDKVLTFHWRGGYLTKSIAEEMFAIFARLAKEKQRHSVVSLNWAQAIVQVSFQKEQTADLVMLQNVYEEENESVSKE